MKLIKQANLLFQEGKSDKVYEVDLCEVAANQYVVNFRYGRRGTALKEGSKTPLPVSQTEAEQVFDKLVASKLSKGYWHVGTTPPVAQKTPEPISLPSIPIPESADPRAHAVLTRLALGEPKATQPPSLLQRTAELLTGKRQGSAKSTQLWSLERAIWRAGELKLSEAEPLLLRLLETGSPLRDYCIVWALGQCGSNQAVPQLLQLYQKNTTSEMVCRIIEYALLELAGERERIAIYNDLFQQLPEHLALLARRGSAIELETAVTEYLASARPTDFAILQILYLLNNEYTRAALLNILRVVPLRPPYFKPIRHIFKAAEFRRDAEVFGLIAYRFEKTSHMFDKIHRYGSRLLVTDAQEKKEYLHIGGIKEIKKQLSSPTSKISYGAKTRHYLRRRVWRTLRRLGELNSPDYVKLAVDVLLPFTDADAQIPRSSFVYRKLPQEKQTSHWTTYDSEAIFWDRYASYWAFNFILYQNSPRYYPANLRSWACRGDYRSGKPAPETREEAFPELWEQAPEQLLRLLEQSRCQPVHQFAVKALRVCHAFCEKLETAFLIRLLSATYEITAQFAFEWIEPRYDATHPDFEFVLAVAHCAYTPARAQACRWIDAQRIHFLQDSYVIASLLTSQYMDIRQFAKTLLRTTPLAEEIAKALIVRLVAFLQTLNETQTEQAADITDALLKGLGPQLRLVGLEVIRDLLQHPLQAVQELGGDILLNYHDLTHLAEDVFHLLLDSPYEAIRGLGMRLLGHLSAEQLVQQPELFTVLSSHALADIRLASQPLIRSLVATHPAFGEQLAGLLVTVLLRSGLSSDVAHHLLTLLKTDLQAHLATISKDTVWKLLKTRNPQAQELGGLLLANVKATELTVAQIVKLADHEILTVRQASWAMCEQNLPALKQEMAITVKLLDAKWEDSRTVAKQLFTTHLTSTELTPEILVSICDSARPEVQQFGRNLITRYFQEAAGQDYLLKLSEHPAVEMQLFVTHYLERHATDHFERLSALRPYFINVLSRVNKGRVTKTRILQFLEREALKNQAVAQLVADILTRQSATMAIGDKAAMIQMMVRLQKVYPAIDLPVQPKALEMRKVI